MQSPAYVLASSWFDSLNAVLQLVLSIVTCSLAVLAFVGVRQVRTFQRRASARQVTAAWGSIDRDGTPGAIVVNDSDVSYQGSVTVVCGIPSGSVARLASLIFERNKPWTKTSTQIHRQIDRDLVRSTGAAPHRPEGHDDEVHRLQVTFSDGRGYWLRQETTVQRLDRLVIWAERTRAETLEQYLGHRSPFLRKTKVRVKVVDFPRTEDLEHAVRQLALGNSTNDAKERPDIVVGPHDWIGDVAASHWVEPLPLDMQERSRFHPAALTALHCDGTLFAVPYVFDTVALIRNNRLTGDEDIPTTFADVIESGRQILAAKQIVRGVPLALQVGPPNDRGEAGDPYHLWPLFSSVGGSFFGLRRQGARDADAGRHDLGTGDRFDGPETWKDDFIEAFRQLAKLGCGPAGNGVLSPQVGRAEALTAFIEQRAPYLVCSSRALKSIKKRGIDVTVTPVPPLGVKTAEHLVSVYGFFIYRHARNMAAARDVLIEYLANPTAGLDLQKFQQLVPVQRMAMRRVGDGDQRLSAYVEQCRNGMIMPSYPQMRKAWNLLGHAEYKVLAGEDNPETIAVTTADAGWELLETVRAGQ